MVDTGGGGDWTVMAEGIPESGTEIGEVRAAGIVLVDQVNATDGIQGEIGGRHKENTDTRARFGEIRPILALRVGGEIRVPIELQRPVDDAEAGLAVGQEILIETRDV